METTNLKLHARKNEPWSQSISIYGILHGEHPAHAVSLMMQTHELGQDVEPFLRITYEAAQALMDELWECGLRPTEGTGSAGALAATQKHLDDMRKLVFSLMDK